METEVKTFSADKETDSMLDKATAKLGDAVEMIGDKLHVAGEEFDPEVHIVGDDNLPEFNAKGKLKRKRGAKKGQTRAFKPTPATPKASKSKSVPSAAKLEREAYHQSAVEIVSAYQGIKVFALGAKSSDETIAEMIDTMFQINEKHGWSPRCPIEMKMVGLVVADIAATLQVPEVQENLEVRKKQLRDHVLLAKIKGMFKRKKKNVSKEEKESADTGRNLDDDSRASRDGENSDREIA